MTACVAVSKNFIGRPIPKDCEPQSSHSQPAKKELPSTITCQSSTSRKSSRDFFAWGIRRLGMLAALVRKRVIARMGQSGKALAS